MHNTIENRVWLLEIEGVRIDESLSRQKARATMGPHTGTEFISVSLCGRRVRLGVCSSSGYHAVLYRDIVVVYHGNRVFVQGKLEQATAHCPRRPHIAISEPCNLNCRACPVPKMQGKATPAARVSQPVRGTSENP